MSRRRGPSPAACRTASRAGDGSGCAGPRARLRSRGGLDSLGRHPPSSSIMFTPAVARARQLDSASRWRASAIASVVLIDVSSGELSTRPRAGTRGSAFPEIGRSSEDHLRPRGLAILARLRRRSTASSSRHAGTGLRPGHVAAARPVTRVVQDRIPRRRRLRLRRSPRKPSSAPWPRFSRPSTGCAGRRARSRSHGPRRLGVALARVRHRLRRPDRCLQRRTVGSPTRRDAGQPHFRRSGDHPQTASVRADSRSSRGLAAARPHRPAATPGRSSTGTCHGGARSGCAGRRARIRPHRGLDSLGHLPEPPIAAPADARAGHVASASRWRASAIASCRRLRRP